MVQLLQTQQESDLFLTFLLKQFLSQIARNFFSSNF